MFRLTCEIIYSDVINGEGPDDIIIIMFINVRPCISTSALNILFSVLMFWTKYGYDDNCEYGNYSYHGNYGYHGNHGNTVPSLPVRQTKCVVKHHVNQSAWTCGKVGHVQRSGVLRRRCDWLLDTVNFLQKTVF